MRSMFLTSSLVWVVFLAYHNLLLLQTHSLRSIALVLDLLFGVSSYVGFSGGHQSQTEISSGSLGHHLTSMGLSLVSSQVPSSFGGGYGGPYGSSHYGGPGSGGYGGLGCGSFLYRLPLGSAGDPNGARYPETGHYGLSSYHISQLHQPVGSSPGPRVPSAGMYPNLPPYY